MTENMFACVFPKPFGTATRVTPALTMAMRGRQGLEFKAHEGQGHLDSVDGLSIDDAHAVMAEKARASGVAEPVTPPAAYDNFAARMPTDVPPAKPTCRPGKRRPGSVWPAKPTRRPERPRPSSAPTAKPSCRRAVLVEHTEPKPKWEDSDDEDDASLRRRLHHALCSSSGGSSIHSPETGVP